MPCIWPAFSSELGMGRDKLSLKRGILVSEAIYPETRIRIEEELGIRVSSGYGIPEAMGPGIAYECSEGRLHVAEDHFIVEIVDQNTGHALPDGEEGELVITTLTTKANPLIRFRTGDVSRIVPNDGCPCTRTMKTIEFPTKRADDGLSIRGVRIYPSQIERIITSALKETPPYMISVYKVNELDELDILIEEVESLFSDEIKILEKMIATIRQDLSEILGIKANIRLVEHVTMDAIKREGAIIFTNRSTKE